MKILKKLVYRIRGIVTTEELIERGMVVGDNFQRQNEVILDPDHCWLIEIGNNVTLAPRVHILCHDASTKHYLGYTKIGKVTIGNNVFIGMNSVILKGVSIGDNVIIGAGSIITKDIESNSVVAGNPAKVICTLKEYEMKINKRQLEEATCLFFDYYNQYKEIPNEEFFDEFFFLFKNNYEKLNNKEKEQLANTGNLEKSIATLNNNNCLFSNYEEFTNYCIKQLKDKNNQNDF